MCELINFVLKCTGCDLQVDVHDIEDPDNVTSKLSDLQDEYQAQQITDYPLISKFKGASFSRLTMTSFIASLTNTAHASGVLYGDLALIENIQVWVTAMSSSAIRPFRHTATVVSLAMASAICDIMKEIYDDTARTMRQKESERKKKPVNKERVAAIEAKVRDSEKKRELAESWLRDIFDTVFIHRYRDVDPRIRVDCATALGNWITTCPDIFFEGQYLRYLGWVLSDISSQTRAEVVKQLLKLYKNKDNVGRLRAFTERFRPRMVEMAAQDAEPGIRASAIELLDLVRGVGLLEPDDIDTIGKLVFDTEPRVRKAVAGFFAENITDVFESTLEELGGEDGLDEALGEDDDDGDYDNPRKAWLKLKCLAEVLNSYDSEVELENSAKREATYSSTLSVIGTDSRYSMAAQVICHGIPEVKIWEILTGYLLFDHSSSTHDQSTSTDDALVAFKTRCQPTEIEERLLLEILDSAVKLRLTEAVQSETDKKGKRSKARIDESRDIQETTALHLAQIIPRLLKKYGANPATASAVLRLEHVLNLEIFQKLRQDSTEYASLLDDINKQFLTHADQNVLAEASTALLHARSFDDLEEITESKMQELWDDTVGSLRVLSVTGRSSQVKNLSNTVCRLSNLASISDCIEIFEAEPRRSPIKGTAAPQHAPTKVTDLLLKFMEDDVSSETQDSDNLITGAMKAMLFYYMWTARSLRAKLDSKNPISSVPSYTSFSSTLMTIISSRSKLSPVRLSAIGTLLDLHTLFATFRHLTVDSSKSSPLSTLIQHVPPKATPLILTSFLAAEKSFAKKSHRTLDGPADTDPPDSDLSDSSSSDDELSEAPSSRTQQARQHERLMAEKRLCELGAKIVLAIVARVLDSDSKGGVEKGQLKERLVRNKSRLGGNFKEVLGFLEEPRKKADGKKGARKAEAAASGGRQGAAQAKKSKEEKSKAVVEEEEESNEEEEADAEEEVEEGGEEDLRRRELNDDEARSGSSEAREDVGEEGIRRDGNGEGNGREEGDDEIMGD